MPKTIALLYHEVVDDPTESGFQNRDNRVYMHKPAVFKEHAEIVKNYLSKNENKVIFTFDDGGISNMRAARILEEKGVKGKFFIPTLKVGSPGFLSENDIRMLSERGHEIGSHSHTHPMIFRSLSDEEMRKEWSTSKKILEEILGKEISNCSVPGGDADERTYLLAEEAGFRLIYDSEPIPEVRREGNAEILGRFSIKNTTTDENLEKTLALANLSALQRNRRIKNRIKRIIFPIHRYIQNRKNEH